MSSLLILMPAPEPMGPSVPGAPIFAHLGPNTFDESEDLEGQINARLDELSPGAFAAGNQSTVDASADHVHFNARLPVFRCKSKQLLSENLGLSAEGHRVVPHNVVTQLFHLVTWTCKPLQDQVNELLRTKGHTTSSKWGFDYVMMWTVFDPEAGKTLISIGRGASLVPRVAEHLLSNALAPFDESTCEVLFEAIKRHLHELWGPMHLNLTGPLAGRSETTYTNLHFKTFGCNTSANFPLIRLVHVFAISKVTSRSLSLDWNAKRDRVARAVSNWARAEFGAGDVPPGGKQFDLVRDATVFGIHHTHTVDKRIMLGEVVEGSFSFSHLG